MPFLPDIDKVKTVSSRDRLFGPRTPHLVAITSITYEWIERATQSTRSTLEGGENTLAPRPSLDARVIHHFASLEKIQDLNGI